jgi:GAF domain
VWTLRRKKRAPTLETPDQTERSQGLERSIPTFYKVDRERKLVLTTGSGFVTREDVLTLQDRMSNDPEFDTSFSQVVDFAQLTDTDIGLADVQTFAQKDAFSSHSRRAIVVKGDVAFGFAKIFELYRQLRGASGIHVFRDPGEAFDWILSVDAAPASRTVSTGVLAMRAANRAREMLDAGVSGDEILAMLANAAEDVAGKGAVCSILVLDKEGLLRNAASPNLPADYLAAIDRLKPNAHIGTCAAAAATGSVVVTRDFRADDKWAELRHLPLSLGFVGAWSMPVKAGDGKVLGTLGTYFRERHSPTPEEISSVEVLAAAAGLVLTKANTLFAALE